MQGMRRWIAQGIVTLGLIGFLAACPGGDDGGGSTSAPTSTTPTTTPTTTTPTATTIPTTTTPTTITPAPGAGQIKSLVIESAENFTSLGTCMIRVKLHNTASQTNSFSLIYNGVDASGVGVAQTIIGGVIPANSASTTFENAWATPSAGTIPCAQIASFRLDASSFAAF